MVYGTAGPEFVRRIIREGVNGDDVRAMIADFVKAEFRPGADGQIERVAQRFGLIAAAGEFAISLEVTPWPAGAAREAAAWAFGAWLESRGLGTGRSAASPCTSAALYRAIWRQSL